MAGYGAALQGPRKAPWDATHERGTYARCAPGARAGKPRPDDLTFSVRRPIRVPAISAQPAYMSMPERWWEKPLPMGVSSLAIALAVALLPMAVDEIRARRRAKPIQIIAPQDSPPVPAGTKACRPADDTAARFIADIRELATSPDSVSASWRAVLRIPQTREADVALVTDHEVCRRVLSAFKSVRPDGSPPSDAYVARVGSVTIGIGPARTTGPTRMHIVMGPRYEVLGSFSR